MVINIQELPREVKDLIELKEQTDVTFNRFCVWEDELVFKNGRLRKMNEITVGDELMGRDGAVRKVLSVGGISKKCLRISIDCLGEVIVSEDHPMVRSTGEIVFARDLSEGDSLMRSNISCESQDGSYENGLFAGAYLADGCACVISRGETDSGCGTRYVKIVNRDEGFLKWCGEHLRNRFGATSFKITRERGKNHYRMIAYGKNCVDSVIGIFGRGVGRGKDEIHEQKSIPLGYLRQRMFSKGFLDGFSSCDMHCGGKVAANVRYSVKSTAIFDCLLIALGNVGVYPNVYRARHKSTGNKHWIVLIPSSQVDGLLDVLDLKTKHKNAEKRKVMRRRAHHDANKIHRVTYVDEGLRIPVVKKIVSVGERRCIDIEVDGDHMFALGNGLVVHNCDEDYTDVLWNLLAERGQEGAEHSFIATFTGTQGSGKSSAAIALCCFLDPTFSADKIYFGYDELVQNRQKLKSGDAVLVDEQSETFGLDSHRVNIILSNLKEQLRKKQIHFIFCAPTLYPEYQSSMYVFETIFIDFETQECFAAMKTRDLLTLGHVRIPYPSKKLEDGSTLASTEVMDAYQVKKDAHLEKVLGQRNVDTFEERAGFVMKQPLFLKAEKIYKRSMGYIPQATLIQIINKILPEYNAGVVPLEIAGRIKLDKELSGTWAVSGRITRADRGGGRKHAG